jgi:hypothetical protein
MLIDIDLFMPKRRKWTMAMGKATKLNLFYRCAKSNGGDW